MGGMEQIGAAWQRASQRIDRQDARRLMEHVLACTHADLIAHPERELSTAQASQLSLIHISEPTRRTPISYAVCARS